MDESVFISPLEVNLNRLISDQFNHWQTQFKQFLSFTECKTRLFQNFLLIFCVVVKELEEERAKSLDKVKSEHLPSNCVQWIKTISTASADFVVLFTEDFRPKVAKELADIEQEQREALKSLKEAQETVKETSAIILKNLNDLLAFFKQKKLTTLHDPWINELSIRHFSAKFLDKKSEYLVTLYRVYTQIRHLNSELTHKLAFLSDEFMRILERFGLAPIDEKSPQIDFAPLSLNSRTTTSSQSTQWENVLKSYSLDYEWKLTCPPLDGFLSTLYNHLKSLGAQITIETGAAVPKIFSESFLRFGFLQKSVSGILTRSWQVNFAILQPSTGFLHLYKIVNKNTAGPEGNLLVPTPGNSYTKSSLHDLNVLATQFYLQSPHQPASISPQSLTPFLSVPIGPNCKIVASDPETFVFLIKPPGGEKVTLKAFCEEEFVDWVIHLNETVKRTPKTTPKLANSSPVIESSPKSTSSDSDASPVLSSTSTSSSEAQTQTATTTSTFASVAVDLENPWE